MEEQQASQLLFKRDPIRSNTSINTPIQESFLLNKLVLNSESLNRVLESKAISRQEIIETYKNALEDPTELF